MPYYAGDYYTGDYYQGDNYAAGGLFGSIGKFIGGAVKKLGGTALSLIPGGSVVKTVASLVQGGVAGRARNLGRSLAPVPMITPLPYGPAELPMGGGGGGAFFGKRRRINPLNIKALRRAMRRAKSFERQARRVGSFFKPGTTYRLKGRKKRQPSA